MSDWHLHWLRLWDRNRFRFNCRLFHRKLKWFHDDSAKRLADLHILSSHMFYGAVSGNGYFALIAIFLSPSTTNIRI